MGKEEICLICNSHAMVISLLLAIAHTYTRSAEKEAKEEWQYKNRWRREAIKR
jgi:predicted histidine transporter YuiF (NhaC family)